MSAAIGSRSFVTRYMQEQLSKIARPGFYCMLPTVLLHMVSLESGLTFCILFLIYLGLLELQLLVSLFQQLLDKPELFLCKWEGLIWVILQQLLALSLMHWPNWLPSALTTQIIASTTA